MPAHSLHPPIRRAGFSISLIVLGLVASCGGDGSPGPVEPGPTDPTPASLAITAGDQQEAPAGVTVGVAPAVVVRDASGQPLSGVSVQFAVIEGSGSVAVATPSTNAAGVASSGSWTLGPNGTQRLQAQVGSLPAVTFEATITPGTEYLVATIGSGGGTFEITDPAHPFHGLDLAVPAGTVSGSAEWRFRVVQQAPTVQLPAGYRVASPVLEITTSQPRTENLLTLEVPVSPEPGEEVMIVLRDPVRGVLEVMPMVGRAESSVRVMTSHLRGDLVLGPPGPGGEPAASGVGMQQFGVPAQLFAIGTQAPMPPASATLNRWPGLDHGSHRYPDGHGAAIAVIQTAASTLEGFLSLASLIRSVDTPGSYAEAAPLAMKILAHERSTDLVTSMMRQVSQELNKTTKWERDRLITNQTIAKMAVEGRVAAMAHGLGELADTSPPVFSTATAAVGAGAGAGLTLVTATEEGATEIPLVEGNGFQSVLVKPVANGAAGQVDDAFPLSSFLVPFEEIASHLQKLGELVGAPLGTPQRAQLNAELSAVAGLPMVQVEVEAVEGGGWFPIDEGRRLVLRTLGTRMRLRHALASSFSLHAAGGDEIGRTETTTLSLSDVAEIAAQPEDSPIPHVVSAFSFVGAGNAARQISAVFQDIVKSPYRIEPPTAEIDGEDTRVEFEVSVPDPPEAGFRVHWDWGDGNESNNLGLTSASHEYDEPGNYTVVSTLRSVNGEVILAADTVQVTSGPGAWGGEVTLAMVAASGTWSFHTTELRLEPGPQIPGGHRWNVVEGETTFSFTESGIHQCALSAPSEVRPVGTGWLEVLGTQLVGYRAAGSMEPWEVTLTADCGNDGTFDSVLTFEEWMGTKRDEDGALVWEMSEDANLLEGSHFFESGGEGEGWAYTWRFERGGG